MLSSAVLHLAPSVPSYIQWLQDTGPWLLLVVAVLIVIETGLLFPFLPGDTLVFAAGLLAPAAGVPIWLIIAVAAVAGIIGDEIGYAIGARYGRRLFKDDARILKTRYLNEAHAFFVKYGPVSVVIARFVPIVRTFVPPMAGVSAQSHRVFTIWNVVGSIVWSVLVGLAGLFLGQIPGVGSNLDIISVLVLVVSLLPIVIGALVKRRRGRREGNARDLPEASDL